MFWKRNENHFELAKWQPILITATLMPLTLTICVLWARLAAKLYSVLILSGCLTTAVCHWSIYAAALSARDSLLRRCLTAIVWVDRIVMITWLVVHLMALYVWDFASRLLPKKTMGICVLLGGMHNH